MKEHIFSKALILIGFFFLTSCHFEHQESSKNKYIKLSENNKTKIVLKSLVNKKNFILWKTKKEKSFHVMKVWSGSKEQSCKNCHQGYSTKKMVGKFNKRSHWNITLKHDNLNGMSCKTCHDQKKVWTFKQGEKRIGANFSPNLCGQCHFKEKKDWILGAHGKRANGWQGERAIKSCTGCHNPHSPKFGKRHPRVAPYRPINNQERL